MRAIYRRRVCPKCQHAWSTFEYQTDQVRASDKQLAESIDEMEAQMAESVKWLREAVKPKA